MDNGSFSYSFYLYANSGCRFIQLVSSEEAFVPALKSMLEHIKYDEGGFQLGLAQYNESLQTDLDSFIQQWMQNVPQVQSLNTLFRSVGIGKYFYVIDAEFPVLNRKIALERLHAIENGDHSLTVHHNYMKSFGLIQTKYEYYSFGFDGIPHYEGPMDKTQRTCRFCHGVVKSVRDTMPYEQKSMPEVVFGKPQNAHAISDALGNKTLFCLEECTFCNGNLSLVENNLVALMDWRRALYKIRNKGNKIPDVFGKGVSLRLDNETGKQFLYVSDQLISKQSDGIVTLRLNNRKQISDQGCYRALCKYVIDLIPKNHLPHFQQTIDWICGKINAVELPNLLVAYDMPFAEQPTLDIYINKEADNTHPFCTALFHTCDVYYLFIIPMVDIDGGRFISIEQLQKHWIEFTTAYKANWIFEDMSDYRPSAPWADINLDLSSDMVKIVSKDNIMLQQPISEKYLKKQAAKPKQVEHEFPEFDPSSVSMEECVIEDVQIHNTLQLPSDSLHNATIHGNLLAIVADIPSSSIDLHCGFSVSDPSDTVLLFNVKFRVKFHVDNITNHISIGEDYLAFDYNLRDCVFYRGCYAADVQFKQKVAGTQYAICSIVKALCEDERTVHFMQYVVNTSNATYRFNDIDVHNNPFS